VPKEFFSLQRTCSLDRLKPGAKIHVIGVCGVAMAQMAVLLSKLGFTVSGSDREAYEPMGSLLSSSCVNLMLGFNAQNVPADVDLVLIGNVVSYGNEEADLVERKNLPYTLFPKLLYELVIAGKHSIVVSGTHGKSTTSALLASSAQRLALAPSYFIGAASFDLPSSLERGSGAISIVEGDEYDSAFFAKIPKFKFYKPNSLIITSIEYDHADIYASLEAINTQFSDLVLSLTKTDRVICCIDDKNIKTLLAEWRKSAKCSFTSYGKDPTSDFVLLSSKPKGSSQEIVIRATAAEFKASIPLSGEYNALNSIAAFIALSPFAATPDQVFAAMKQFKGVRRRQELRFDRDEMVVIEDFAHHPTAVFETLNGIRKAYPKKRIWAVFEPRSNTSRKKVFQADYVRAFASADRAVLCEVQARTGEDQSDLLSVAELSQAITKSGVQSTALQNSDKINELLLKELKPGDLALIMSNGSFGGLIDKLLAGLNSRATNKSP